MPSSEQCPIHWFHIFQMIEIMMHVLSSQKKYDDYCYPNVNMDLAKHMVMKRFQIKLKPIL